jgi:hypothetical protein
MDVVGELVSKSPRLPWLRASPAGDSYVLIVGKLVGWILAKRSKADLVDALNYFLLTTWRKGRRSI